MKKRHVKKNTVASEVKSHINRFCNIRDYKTRLFIIKKLSETLTNTAKAEIGRGPDEITFSSVLNLVKQYLSRLRMGFCIHDKRQDGYVLLQTEKEKMEKNKQYPKDLCATCISPRVCKLRSVMMNEEKIAGLFTNIKKFT
jgi:hypothetical protein